MMRDPGAFRPQGGRWIATKIKIRIKHFRDRERSAETFRRAAHAEVGDAGHGGEKSAPAELKGTGRKIGRRFAYNLVTLYHAYTLVKFHYRQFVQRGNKDLGVKPKF